MDPPWHLISPLNRQNSASPLNRRLHGKPLKDSAKPPTNPLRPMSAAPPTRAPYLPSFVVVCIFPSGCLYLSLYLHLSVPPRHSFVVPFCSSRRAACTYTFATAYPGSLGFSFLSSHRISAPASSAARARTYPHLHPHPDRFRFLLPSARYPSLLLIPSSRFHLLLDILLATSGAVVYPLGSLLRFVSLDEVDWIGLDWIGSRDPPIRLTCVCWDAGARASS
ncbi:hypothetical protein B0H17DRAFT_451169 [Mycena rosella]|uniref:Uncharacterized protein n=1 Tax=Mycena rosella TaxID=1033263 RepID=A0AAD7GYE8_MYCRO|nr:hypothetical protein B0H17DRAFT_451169 [Mycena rosella]